MILLDLQPTNRSGMVRCSVFGTEYSSNIVAYSIEDIAKEVMRRVIVQRSDNGKMEQLDDIYVDVSAYGIVLANELKDRGVKVHHIRAANIDLWLPRDRIVEVSPNGDTDLRREFII